MHRLGWLIRVREITMSLKPLFLHYALNAVLMGLKLAPVTPTSGVKFIRLDSYSPQILNHTSVRTDVVITRTNIEIHAYSPDPRERHGVLKCSSTKEFLDAFIKPRIECAVRYRASSSPNISKLNANSDYETFSNAALKLESERNELRNYYHHALEKRLNGLCVKITSLILGF
jgi:hypothetical protein